MSLAMDLHRRGLRITWIPRGQKLFGRNDWEASPALTDAQVAAMFPETNPPNVGVLTGSPSNAFVLDIDQKDGKDGAAVLRRLIAAHGDLPATFCVATPTGGWHLYFAMPDFEVRNSAGILGRLEGSKEATGLDIRGTGGYVVGPGSTTADGTYRVVSDAPIAAAPEWLLAWLRSRVKTYTEVVPAAQVAAASSYWDAAVRRELARLAELRDAATPNPADYRGAPWNVTTNEVAFGLGRIEAAGGLPTGGALTLLMEHAPRDAGFTDDLVLEMGRRAVADAASKPHTGPKADPFANVPKPEVATTPAGTVAPALEVGDLDVTNPAIAVEWLRRNLGRGPLSGIFARGTDVVFTPRVGKEGYVEPRVGQAESSASISVLDYHSLAARIQRRYRVVQQKDGKVSAALFPPIAAMHAIKAPDDMEGLRQLQGVIHGPSFRPDGSLIRTPGFDEATGLLLLPTGGQPGPIPDDPSAEDADIARKWLDYMLQDFRFVSVDDRTNYLGLMLTPLLRSMVPAPYKLGVIEAHQPGSGKTFLARALTSIHTGVMHPEMPTEEPELVKTITSILDTQTGAVVVFDNVSGVVRSSALAGLLTSPTFAGRRLGTGQMVSAVNDRLWVITGNNAALGGDLARRSLRVHLDPGVPNPEARTRFAIPDFEQWVRDHRGELLWSLIVLVRRWISVGAPLPAEIRADSYGRWAAVVGSILATAGVPGTFDDPLAVESNDPDLDEWGAFFAKVYELNGDTPWTVKALLQQVAPQGIDSVFGAHVPPIPFDLLPSALLQGKSFVGPIALARPLGMFLKNREGRWFGSYAARRMPSTDRDGKAFWRIVRHGA